MRYAEEVFSTTTLEQAKNIVLTTDPDNPNKFQEETDFLVNTIIAQNIITPN